MPLNDKDFEMLAKFRDEQERPCDADISFCADCNPEARQVTNCESTGGVSVRATVRLFSQRVVSGGVMSEVVGFIDADWSQATDGALRGGGDFTIERPILDKKGRMKVGWSSLDASQSMIDRKVDIGRLEALACEGPNEDGLCPIALAVASDTCQKVVERPLS